MLYLKTIIQIEMKVCNNTKKNRMYLIKENYKKKIDFDYLTYLILTLKCFSIY